MQKIPRLTKKRRTLADLGADSLAAALHYQELAPANQEQPDQPTDQEQANPPQIAPTKPAD